MLLWNPSKEGRTSVSTVRVNFAGEHGRTMFAYVSEGAAASVSLATVLGPRAAPSRSGGTTDEA